jgi:hypothetical protein
VDQAKRLQEAHKAEIDTAVKELANRQRLIEAQRTLGIGRDVDPIWLHDLTVVPGRTYRYRLRIVAVNPYAGMPNHVEHAQDAAALTVASTWSEWSDPQMAEPTRVLFFTGGKEDSQTARLEYHQWADGEWKPVENLELAIGQPVASTGKRAFSYGAILTDIDYHRPWIDRSVRPKDGAIEYRAKSSGETSAITLLKLDGAAEERIAAQENAEKRVFLKKKQEEIQRLQVPRPVLQGPVMPAGPAGPGPGQFDPRRGGGRRSGRMMEEGT